MKDLIIEAGKCFGRMCSYREIIFSVNTVFESTKLPTEGALLRFIDLFGNNDTSGDMLELLIKDSSGGIFETTGSGLWIDEYREYIKTVDDNDIFAIEIEIRKDQSTDAPITIYSLLEFSKELHERKTEEQLELFSELLKDRKNLRFNVLNSTARLYTHHIGFCGGDDVWPIDGTSRAHELKLCNDASVFSDRHRIGLLPQDFEILRSNDAKTLEDDFGRLETLLSCAYIASSSYINNGKLVAQIEPGRVLEIGISLIQANRCICEIYKWAFSGETAMERASIARNVMKIYCASAEEFLSIDDNVLTSIKSNYVIYQKDTLSKYIEMKEKISDYILDMTKQFQDIAHGLADGVKNNFIAVVTFLISVVLTNSLTEEELFKNGLSSNMQFVIYIFIGASILYLCITLIAATFKWRTVRIGYDQLKGNYSGVLDKEDIKNAFSCDKPINDTRSRLIVYTIITSIIWLTFIVGMIAFAMYFANKDIHSNEQRYINVFDYIMQ